MWEDSTNAVESQAGCVEERLETDSVRTQTAPSSRMRASFLEDKGSLKVFKPGGGQSQHVAGDQRQEEDGGRAGAQKWSRQLNPKERAGTLEDECDKSVRPGRLSTQDKMG